MRQQVILIALKKINNGPLVTNPCYATADNIGGSNNLHADRRQCNKPKKSCSSSSLVDVHTFWSIWQWIENMTLCLRQASIYQIGGKYLHYRDTGFLLDMNMMPRRLAANDVNGNE